MNVTQIISALVFVGGLLAYIATGRIARRSPHYGGGTVVLSWIGFFVPCIAWIAVYHGWSAVKRAVETHPSPESLNNKKAFTTWALIYVAAMVLAGVLGSQR
jgi:hypothetical protein